MLFNSFQYLVFLPLVVIAYFLLPHKFRWVLLLGASYYFYMVWKPEYILLIVVSTLVDYFAGILMEKQETKAGRKPFLLASLFVNLGLLFVFKYFNFFNQELGKLYEAISHHNYSIASLRLLLPMGISFYTFQTLSYSIDVYRGTRKAEHHIGYFALYVTFFPQLVAGPIERSDRLLPQLKAHHKPKFETIMSALLQICWGFFLKVVIADRAAVIVNRIYGDIGSFDGVYMIIGTLAFAIQIYCDFSAYSSIALGSARLLGIELMQNFAMPYFSKSITEFWKRWHISLSTWFKDYLYIPLGGNRVAKPWKVYRNVFLVFIISGVWHGANWTFLVWGGLHGLYQMTERFIQFLKIKKGSTFSFPKIIKQLFTFTLVLLAWVFFRADTIGDAFTILSKTSLANASILLRKTWLDPFGMGAKEFIVLAAAVLWMSISDGIRYKTNRFQLIQNQYAQGLVSVFLILIILLFGAYGRYDVSNFIYFQF